MTMVWGLAVALALSSAAPAQTPPPATPAFIVRRSPFLIDCSPATPADEACRVPAPFDSNVAEQRLAGRDFVSWVTGDVLNIAARSTQAETPLTGTFAEDMSPLSMGRPYWGAAYRLPHLDQSLIEMKLSEADPADRAWIYRGLMAPAAPPANAELKGRFEVVEIASAALGSSRKISVYTPPGPAPKGGWPAIIAPDGDAIGPYVAILDALIARGDIEPTALVAVWPQVRDQDLAPRGASSHEYIRGADAAPWARHAAFVKNEVLPLVQTRYAITADPSRRMLFGYGNGADWVLETAARDPASARSAAAFSIPGASEPPFRPGKGRDLRLYLAAGAYEAPYLKGARAMYNLAVASGVPCSLDVVYAGHTPLFWEAEFAKVVRQVFPATSPRSKPPPPPPARPPRPGSTKG
jgi:enterochelin esterase family protein